MKKTVSLLKTTALGALALGMLAVAGVPLARAQDMSGGADNFYASEQVTVRKVAFRNQFRVVFSRDQVPDEQA